MILRSPTIFETVHRAHRQADAIFRQIVGMPPSRFFVLAAVDEHPGRIQSEIMGALGIEKSMAGRIILDFVDRDLIRREPSNQDRRSEHLWLTLEGERMLSEARPKVAEAEAILAVRAGRSITVINQALQLIAEKEAA